MRCRYRNPRWRCMSVLAAFLQEDFPRNSLDMVFGRSQTQSGFYTKEKNVLLLPVTEPRFFCCTVSSSFSTATDWSVLFPLCKVGHSYSSIQLKFHICFWETASLQCYSAWRLSSDLQHVYLHLIICIVPYAIRFQL